MKWHRIYSLATVLALACSEITAPPTDHSVTSPSMARASAPTGLTVSSISAVRIDVTWVDSEKNETGWEIERSTTGAPGTFALHAITSANTQSFSDNGPTVAPSIPYCYRARAYRRTQARTTYSPYSSIACAASGSVSVTTTTSGEDVDGDGYELVLSAVTPTGTTVVANRATPSNGTVTFEGLRTGNHYQSALTDIAANCRVESSDPRPLTVIAGTTSAPYSVGCDPLGPPYPAGFPMASPLSSSTIWVTWLHDSPGEDGFRVERSLDEGLNWNLIATLSPDSTSFTDQGRASEAVVCYRVTAFSKYGDAPPLSDPCTAPPAAPSNLSVIAVDGGMVELHWTDNSAVEDGYRILVFTPGWGFDWLDLPPDATSAQYSGFGDPYAAQYTVVATRDGGVSDQSNMVEAPPRPESAVIVRSTNRLIQRGN